MNTEININQAFSVLNNAKKLQDEISLLNAIGELASQGGGSKRFVVEIRVDDMETKVIDSSALLLDDEFWRDNAKSAINSGLTVMLSPAKDNKQPVLASAKIELLDTTVLRVLNVILGKKNEAMQNLMKQVSIENTNE